MKQTPFKTSHFMRGLSSMASRVPLLLSLACLGLSAPVLAQENISQDRKAEGTRAWALPVIEAQPQSQAVTVGQKASFSVKASGRAVAYQWFKNGKVILGAVRSAYTTANTLLADSGSQYTVRVMSLTGTVWSEAAALTVNPPAVAPSIVAQPAQQTVTAGQSATFNVVATGKNPLTYQWFKNGGAIQGANTASYTTVPTVLADNGAQFTVSVSNSGGTVTSNPALLVVNVPPPVISSFQAANPVVTVWEGTTLSWVVAGATRVSLDQGFGDVTGLSFKETGAIFGTKTYTLTATNALGASCTATVTVRCVPAPEITTFEAEPSAIVNGGSCKLRAVFSGGLGTITPGGMTIASSVPFEVYPHENTTYTLTVINELGAKCQSSIPVSVGMNLGHFESVGKMSAPRKGHTSTLLTNGKILIVGGVNSNGAESLAIAELYDPSNGVCAPTGALNYPREDHTATLLEDGRVLIAGGHIYKYGDWEKVKVIEIYDPASGSFEVLTSLNEDYCYHTANLLPDGNVVFLGGSENSEFVDLFNPGFQSLIAIPNPSGMRRSHTATLLTDGRIVYMGGLGKNGYLDDVVIYDPSLMAFTEAGKLVVKRDNHSAILLPNGKILVVGGSISGIGEPFTEIFDPLTGESFRTGNMSDQRGKPACILLKDERVLIIGGNYSLDTADVFDYKKGAVVSVIPMVSGREEFSATQLPDGRVVVVGGRGQSRELLDSIEVYIP